MDCEWGGMLPVLAFDSRSSAGRNVWLIRPFQPYLPPWLDLGEKVFQELWCNPQCRVWVCKTCSVLWLIFTVFLIIFRYVKNKAVKLISVRMGPQYLSDFYRNLCHFYNRSVIRLERAFCARSGRSDTMILCCGIMGSTSSDMSPWPLLNVYSVLQNVYCLSLDFFLSGLRCLSSPPLHFSKIGLPPSNDVNKVWAVEKFPSTPRSSVPHLLRLHSLSGLSRHLLGSDASSSFPSVNDWQRCPSFRQQYEHFLHLTGQMHH